MMHFLELRTFGVSLAMRKVVPDLVKRWRAGYPYSPATRLVEKAAAGDEKMLDSLLSATKSAIFLGVVATSASMSQNSPAFRSNADLVVVSCSVVDANGTAVEGLTRDEFAVFDNGVKRIVEHFEFETDLPLTLGVLIDASVSQSQLLMEHRQTTGELLERILRLGDRAFVISVEEDVRMWADLTGDMADIRDKLARNAGGSLFGQPCPKGQHSAPGTKAVSQCGSSPIWSALRDASKARMRSLQGSKALLVLTDGFDSGSSHTWREAADEALRADTTIYAIQYQSAFGRRFASDLYRIVGETGGTWFRAPGGAYGPIASRLDTDLRRRYTLGFRPERLSMKNRHEVRIKVRRPDLTVRGRKTYFRNPE
jgi:VWFA-related protein